MTALPQQEFIGEQTAHYHCKRCGELTIAHKELHIHEDKLCEGCYHHVQPYLDV